MSIKSVESSADIQYRINGGVIVEKHVSEDDINNFAFVSGDFNPIHIDQKVAEESRFHGRVAHGMLLGSYISAVLGNEFPGEGTIYLSQMFKFLKPVYVGTDIKVSVHIVRIEKENIAVLQTNILDIDDEILVEGEAKVILP